MATLLECIVLAATRLKTEDATERDFRLLNRYGEVDQDSRTVKFNLEKIAKKTQLHPAILSARLNQGAGTSASAANETGWFSKLSTRTISRRATGLVHTGNQRVTKMLNGPR